MLTHPHTHTHVHRLKSCDKSSQCEELKLTVAKCDNHESTIIIAIPQLHLDCFVFLCSRRGRWVSEQQKANGAKCLLLIWAIQSNTTSSLGSKMRSHPLLENMYHPTSATKTEMLWIERLAAHCSRRLLQMMKYDRCQTSS